MRQQNPRAPLLLTNAEVEASYQPQRCTELSLHRFQNLVVIMKDQRRQHTVPQSSAQAGQNDHSYFQTCMNTYKSYKHNPDNGKHSGLLIRVLTFGLALAARAWQIKAYSGRDSQAHHCGGVSRPASQHLHYSLSTFLATSLQSNPMIRQI